jgi:hypothetical protein
MLKEELVELLEKYIELLEREKPSSQFLVAFKEALVEYESSLTEISSPTE